MIQSAEDATRDLPVTGAPGQVTPASRRSRVLLAEDPDLFRGALTSLLSREPDLEVVAALKCRADRVLSMALRLRPDVAVVDVGRCPIHGMTIIWRLRSQLPGCPIVALVPAQPPVLAVRLFSADVRGVVDSNAPAARLLEAIRGAIRAETVIDLHLAIAAVRQRPNPLTPRELNVLRLAAGGESDAAIAGELHLAMGTVRNYLSKAIGKTQARTKLDAIRIANEVGWI